MARPKKDDKHVIQIGVFKPLLKWIDLQISLTGETRTSYFNRLAVHDLKNHDSHSYDEMMKPLISEGKRYGN